CNSALLSASLRQRWSVMQPAPPQAVRYERHVGVVLLVTSLPAGPSSCGLAAWSRQSQSEATPYPCTYRSSDDPTAIGVFAGRKNWSPQPVITESAFRAPHSVQRSSLILPA